VQYRVVYHRNPTVEEYLFNPNKKGNKQAAEAAVKAVNVLEISTDGGNSWMTSSRGIPSMTHNGQLVESIFDHDSLAKASIKGVADFYIANIKGEQANWSQFDTD
jgi:hypothetical protein